MTPVEQELIALQELYRKTDDPAVRERYRVLHAKWMALKAA